MEIDGETVSDFILGGSKITADGDCSHEVKRRLFVGRKFMTNLDSILKSRDITLPTKVCLLKAELDYKESWAQKNWCFWTVVLQKTLESPLDSKEIHQSILKEISPEYSLEGLMLKPNLQNFGHLSEELTHLKRPWCKERLKAGGELHDRGWDGWMASPTQWT